jgi:hypothetical protein
MKMSYTEFRQKFAKATKVWRLEEDWITPVEYLPYIDALLGDIDLDPCSTKIANDEFIHAHNFYTKEDDALNLENPWTGSVYCFPPTYGRCSFNKQRGTWRWGLRAGFGAMSPSSAWFKRMEREWKLRNIREGLFFSCSHEMMRTIPSMWDYPVCIPHKRANLIQGKKFFRFKTPFTWGFFVYFPEPSLGFQSSERFREIFSNIGTIIN